MTAETFLEQLLREARTLVDTSPSPEALQSLALLLLLLFLALPPIRMLRQSSAREGLRGALLGLLLLVAVAAVGLGALLGRERPIVGTFLFALPFVAWLIHLARRLGPWWSGLGLVLGGHLRPGDLVAVGRVEGRFEGADLLRARLLSTDGERVFLPWSALAGEVFARTAGAARLVQIPVDLPHLPSPEERSQIELRAMLCPYRLWDRPVFVHPSLERAERLDVRLWTWSDEAASLAGDYLRRSLERDVEKRSPADRAPR